MVAFSSLSRAQGPREPGAHVRHQHLGGHSTVNWCIRQTFSERPPGADTAGGTLPSGTWVPWALSRTQRTEPRWAWSERTPRWCVCPWTATLRFLHGGSRVGGVGAQTAILSLCVHTVVCLCPNLL